MDSTMKAATIFLSIFNLVSCSLISNPGLLSTSLVRSGRIGDSFAYSTFQGNTYLPSLTTGYAFPQQLYTTSIVSSPIYSQLLNQPSWVAQIPIAAQNPIFGVQGIGAQNPISGVQGIGVQNPILGIQGIGAQNPISGVQGIGAQNPILGIQGIGAQNPISGVQGIGAQNPILGIQGIGAQNPILGFPGQTPGQPAVEAPVQSPIGGTVPGATLDDDSVSVEAAF